MRPSSTTLFCMLWLFAATYACAQTDPMIETGELEGPRVGRYTTMFTERSPLSTVEAVTERFRYHLKEPLGNYILADESFWVYVPDAYDGSEPYGLLVWIDAGTQGGPPEHYQPVLDQHKLIWVGANNSGNQRSFWYRAGLALDGLYNIKQQYHIDPMRIYVSGISGGGRSASRVGPTYADEFAGMFAIIGVDFFKRLPHPETRNNMLTFWGAAFNPPNPRMMRRAKRDGRYVLLTGETDGNRIQTLATYEYGYKRGQFKHITYLEVPGMGHALPPAEWFEKGIVALDEPLDDVRTRREFEAEVAHRKAVDILRRSHMHGIAALRDLLRDYGDTTYAPLAEAALQDALINQPDESEPDTQAQIQAPPVNKAREELALAKNYLAAGRNDLARDLLKDLIAEYPESKEAETAQALLRGIAPQ